MDAAFFFNLAFSSTQGEIKGNVHGDRAMLLNINEAQAFPPVSTDEKNPFIWLFLKGQFSCFTYDYIYNDIINKNTQHY